MSWTRDGVLTVLIPWCCVVTMIWKDDPELSQMFVNGPNENIDGGSCTLPDTMEAKLYRMMPVALDCTIVYYFHEDTEAYIASRRCCLSDD